jgi:hypothetical protein
MPDQLSDQDQTRMALAVLFAALGKALDAPEGTVSQRFDENLERLYREARESEHDTLPVLQTLKWTSELMRKL